MSNEFGPGHYGNTNEVADRPTPIATGKPSDRWFGQCDANGEGGTNIDEMWLNTIIAHLRNSTRKAGVAQAELDDDMLAEALSRTASGGRWYADSGTANAKVLAGPGNFVMPKSSYFEGEEFNFIPLVSNTGGTTFNATSRGAKKILNWDGTALQKNALVAGRPASGVFRASADSGAGAMLLYPWSPTQHPNFEIKENVTQTIPTGVLTRYTNMGSVVRNNLLSGSIASSRVTLGAREGGLWLINWQTNILSDESEMCVLRINGTGVNLGTQAIGVSTVQMLSWVGLLADGDEIEWWTSHGSGVSRDTNGYNRAFGLRLLAM